MFGMNVAVIIVTYNGIKWIDKCINSLINSSIPLNIIVIDNGSTDETQDALKKYNIQFIPSSENLGFAKANNKGISLAIQQNCNYVFLLNQDAWVEKNTIETLINIAASNPEFGVLSPMHLNGSYTALDIKFTDYLMPQNCKNLVSDMYINKLKSLYEAIFVNAAAWLIPVDCIKKVGLFEPFFFLYGEDNNYLQRIRHHKFKIGITPTCTICHDREIREGKLNINTKNWVRAESLILLLDISRSLKITSLLFIKEKIKHIAASCYKTNLLHIQYQIAEIFFFIFKFRKIKATRNSYKRMPVLH
jgi:GT2 family glycosyltransferase